MRTAAAAVRTANTCNMPRQSRGARMHGLDQVRCAVIEMRGSLERGELEGKVQGSVFALAEKISRTARENICEISRKPYDHKIGRKFARSHKI